MENVLHFYFNSIEEVKQQEDSLSINYLNNPYAERNYFAPLSVMHSHRARDEYLVSNYMEKMCYCVHTPYSSNLYQETLMHKHDFFEFMYVSSGVAHIRIENTDFSYGAGDVCLLNRNTSHKETDISDADLYYIGIEPQMLIGWPNCILPPFPSKGILDTFFKTNLSEKGVHKKDYVRFSALCECDLRKTIEEIITAFSEKRIGYNFDIYSSLSRFFAALEDRKQYKADYIDLGYDRDSFAVEQAKKRIFECHGRIKRQELARELNYTKEHLSRIFKKHTGYTLKYYCQQIQMQEAAKLLRSTDLPISQITLSLGHENRTHFYKTFKTIYQMSPAEYRAEKRRQA